MTRSQFIYHKLWEHNNSEKWTKTKQNNNQPPMGSDVHLTARNQLTKQTI